MKNIKQKAVELKVDGMSSREVAALLDVSKSSVNNWVAQWMENPYVLYDPDDVAFKPKKKPKILLLDVETTADIVATFGRKNVNISEDNIVVQGNELICAAYSFTDENTIHCVRSKFKDYTINLNSEMKMLTALVDVISDSDAVVIHNARFDLGVIQQRMLFHGMGKLPSVKVVDTLMLSRKYLKLRSNKLDSITKYFNLSNKMKNSGISLWINTQKGCEDSMREMMEYNIQDVKALRDVYNTFVPLGTGINFGKYNESEDVVCPSCGSKNIELTGRLIHTSVSAFDEYVCEDCGGRFRSRKNVIPKDKQKLLLL